MQLRLLLAPSNYARVVDVCGAMLANDGTGQGSWWEWCEHN
jgi:hypothetical protein